MKILGVIPARYNSTRFPGKPLALINGKSMIYRVYTQSKQALLLSDVVVATDDQRIMDHVLEFGGKVLMTNPSHPSGTDRCAEILSNYPDTYDAVINIQGDEPYIHPEQINLVAGSFQNPDIQISTLVKVITDSSELENTNIPKVVLAADGRALYFSRRAIPFCKEDEKSEWIRKGLFYKHIGIYGYRSDILAEVALLQKSNLEMAESLEQLRWLENNFTIYAAVSEHDNHAVDTPEDVISIEKLFPSR